MTLNHHPSVLEEGHDEGDETASEFVSNLAFDDQADIFAHPAILLTPHPANLNILISVMEKLLAILVKMAGMIRIAIFGGLLNARRPGTKGASGAVNHRSPQQ